MATSDIPWKNGYWIGTDRRSIVYLVEDKEVVIKHIISLEHDFIKDIAKATWTFGEFGEAPEDITEESGAKHYNVEIEHTDYGIWKQYGVMTQCGTKIFTKGFDKKVSVLQALFDENDLTSLKEKFEDFNFPVCPYVSIKSDLPGKLIWLSGIVDIVNYCFVITDVMTKGRQTCRDFIQ